MPRRTHPTHENKSSFVMSGVHDRMLREAIATYHFLTAKQITRLLYPTPKLGNLTTVQAKLKELTDHKYLHSFYLPLPQKQRPYVYCLGRRGRTEGSGSSAFSCVTMASPDLDGSYGNNPNGIFFFTTTGAYVEWSGTYVYSSQPLSIQTPVSLTEQVH